MKRCAAGLLALVLAAGLGRPVLWIMERILGQAYEGKLTCHHVSFILIVMGGACYAFLSLHYYALVIMRRQKVIFGSAGQRMNQRQGNWKKNIMFHLSSMRGMNYK